MDTFRTRFTCVPVVLGRGTSRAEISGVKENSTELAYSRPSRPVVAPRLNQSPSQPAPLKTILRRRRRVQSLLQLPGCVISLIVQRRQQNQQPQKEQFI